MLYISTILEGGATGKEREGKRERNRKKEMMIIRN